MITEDILAKMSEEDRKRFGINKKFTATTFDQKRMAQDVKAYREERANVLAEERHRNALEELRKKQLSPRSPKGNSPRSPKLNSPRSSRRSRRSRRSRSRSRGRM